MVRPPLNHGPGVYTQEVPSGSHPIVGVSTSVTAFVGRFASGPLGHPVAVSDYASAVATFGNVLPDSPVTYALRDFFQNGGVQAVIVRLYGKGAAARSNTSDSPTNPAGTRGTRGARGSSSTGDPESGGTTTAKASAGGMEFLASSPGKWGDSVSVSVTAMDEKAAARYAPLGLRPEDLFDVKVTYEPTPEATTATPHPTPAFTLTETISGVTSIAGTHRADLVLEQLSKYVRLAVPPKTLTAQSDVKFAGGADSPDLVETDYTDPATGFAAVLEKAPVVNLLVLPPDIFGSDVPPAVLTAAAKYCQDNLAFLLVEPPGAWSAAAATGDVSTIDVTTLTVTGPESEFAAVYFPPARFPGLPSPYPLTGILAGLYAYTDATRGVWKAPAGLAAAIPGTTGLSVGLDGVDRNTLNKQGINALRDVPSVGTVVWGARTMNGADVIGSDYKYVPVRRLTSYIEASLTLGIQWAVFEPNDETLWSRLRLAIGTFMGTLFRQGAFAGTSAKDAWFVKCDATTTTPADQAAGIVNVVIGFAPVKPAEFIILYLQQTCASSS